MDRETAARIVGAGSPRRVFHSAEPLKAEKHYTSALGRYKEAQRVLAGIPDDVYTVAPLKRAAISHSDAGLMVTTYQWLIERGQPEGYPTPNWLCAPDDEPGHNWTEEARRAYMFPDRESAEKYIAESGLRVGRAVEHGFGSQPKFDPHPPRLAVDANGYVWRDYGEYWSMCPVNPDNEPIPEPITFYEPLSTDSRSGDFANALTLHKERIAQLQDALCGCEARGAFGADEHDQACPVYAVAHAAEGKRQP